MDQRLGFLVLVQYPSPRGIRCTEPVGKRPKRAGPVGSRWNRQLRSFYQQPQRTHAAQCRMDKMLPTTSQDDTLDGLIWYRYLQCAATSTHHFPGSRSMGTALRSSTLCADFPYSNFPRDMSSRAIRESKHERTITRNNGKDGRDGTGKERGAHG